MAQPGYKKEGSMDSKEKQEFNLKKRTLSRDTFHALTEPLMCQGTVVVLYIGNTNTTDNIPGKKLLL